jgi:dihydroflavonol-4-reductase
VIRCVAVTGANGFIGRHLTMELAGHGIEVRALQRRDAKGPVPPNVTVIRTTLERARLMESFRGVDCVVHLAGLVGGLRERDFTTVNVDGTREVAEAARAADVRLVHVSSLAAAGPASAMAPRTEDDPPAPITPYGRSKLESERVVAGIPGLRWLILRPSVVYGPYDRAMLPLFQYATRGVLPLVGHAAAAYTFIHVSDVVRALDAAVRAPIDGDTIFLGHPRPATARQVLEAIRAAVGRSSLIVRVPDAILRVGAVVGELGGRMRGRPLPLNRWRYTELSAPGFTCRVDRLRDRLGIVASVELTDGLAQTAEWYRQHGWIG